jgi:seryl-tRNA synthetase
MPVDIVLFRADQGGNPELIRETLRRRYKPVELVDQIIELDNQRRKIRYESDQTNSQKNALNKQIGEKKKAGENADDLLAQRAVIDAKIEKLNADVVVADKAVEHLLNSVGNIVHADVPISNNEDNNKVVRTWGERKVLPKHHHELLYMIDGYDSARGVGVAGHRAYFLKGVGVQLNFAIQMYGMDFLSKKGHTMLQPPYMMRKEVMARTAQLEQFDEELYKVIGGKDSAEEHEEKEAYLIATSEQPISAFHQNEWLDPKDLPLRYGGVSTCFRKEAGAHGKDTWGIFRVHQFEKIEQFCITAPEDSWKMHDEMIHSSEEFYQSLGIPYQVIDIVSGALNNAASRKFDLEGWFPGFQEFRELVSCSNCTDYQSRHMEIRFGGKKTGEKEKKYVHMLNATLCATTRTICAILENYQTETGINVPVALQSYMGGKTFIPFVKEAPKTPKPQPQQKGGKKDAADTKVVAAAADNNNNNAAAAEKK